MKTSIVETTVEATKEVATTVQETTMEKITTTIQEVTSAVTEVVTAIAESTSANNNSCSTWQGIYDVLDVANIILGIIVSVTAIWIFVKTYLLKNVKFLSWRCGYSIYSGYSIGVMIQSRSLSTLSIREVSVILDNSEEVSLMCIKEGSEDEHLIIEPFKTKQILSEGSITPLLDKKALDKYDKLQLRLVFSDGSSKKIKFKYKKDKNKEDKKKYPKTTNYEGVLCTKHLKYVIVIKDILGNKNIYPVYRNGIIKNNFYGYNFLKEDVIRSVESLTKFVEDTIISTEIIIDIFENPYCEPLNTSTKEKTD